MSQVTETGYESEDIVEEIRSKSAPLRDTTDLDPLIDYLGDVQYALLGEASHGTSEFYTWRARLTARLIKEHDVSFIGVEGDWPDCYRINEFVLGDADPTHGVKDVLTSFERWPTWMWSNWEFLEFVEWLRDYNLEQPREDRVRFYGLDVYSLFESMERVIEYLEDVDPEAAEDARDAFECFEPYGPDAREYAKSLRMTPEGCRGDVVEVLTEIREKAAAYEELDGESYFDAEQNALVAKNAEEYYRAWANADVDSWNVRDYHMADTLERLVDFHDDGDCVVWAHNTHIGDARATSMKDRGHINLGQVIREGHRDGNVGLVGFGSHHGEVIAADRWGAKREAMPAPPARAESYEDLFHRATDGEDSLVMLDDEHGALAAKRGHRAIGVVYDPAHEGGNYVPTHLANRYDAFLYFDETDALSPLPTTVEKVEEPETYPWGV